MRKFFDRVRFLTSTEGQGTLAVGSAFSNRFCTPADAGMADGDSTVYVIEEGNDFEIGIGAYAESGPSLSRDTVLLSKINGTAGTTKMTLAGSAVVRFIASAGDINAAVRVDEAQSFTAGQRAQAAQNIDAAQLSVEDQTVSGGARVTVKDLGTISSGTVTPDPGDRAMQKYTNGGAHTLAPGTNYGMYMLDIINNASAGAITTSGWTKVAGSSFTTTNGHKFRCHCSVTADGSLMIVQAMQ